MSSVVRHTASTAAAAAATTRLREFKEEVAETDEDVEFDCTWSAAE